MKKQQNTVLAISQIAQKNPNGFTVDHNLRPITNGYSVATKYTQNSFGLTGLAHVVAIALFQNIERFDGVGGSQKRTQISTLGKMTKLAFLTSPME